MEEPENFDLEQTVYVNDSQEPPLETVDQDLGPDRRICFQLEWSDPSRLSNRTLKMATCRACSGSVWRNGWSIHLFDHDIDAFINGKSRKFFCFC